MCFLVQTGLNVNHLERAVSHAITYTNRTTTSNILNVLLHVARYDQTCTLYPCPGNIQSPGCVCEYEECHTISIFHPQEQLVLRPNHPIIEETGWQMSRGPPLHPTKSPSTCARLPVVSVTPGMTVTTGFVPWRDKQPHGLKVRCRLYYHHL